MHVNIRQPQTTGRLNVDREGSEHLAAPVGGQVMKKDSGGPVSVRRQDFLQDKPAQTMCRMLMLGGMTVLLDEWLRNSRIQPD